MLPLKRLGARRRFFDPRDQETRIVQGGGVVLRGPMESAAWQFPTRPPPDRDASVVSGHEEPARPIRPIRTRRLSDPAPGQRPPEARVGDPEQQTAAPPEDAVKFSERLLIPHDVLQDDVRHDEVERLVTELRQAGQVAFRVIDAARVEGLLSACDRQQLGRMIDPRDLRTSVRQEPRQISRPGACVQDPTASDVTEEAEQRRVDYPLSVHVAMNSVASCPPSRRCVPALPRNAFGHLPHGLDPQRPPFLDLASGAHPPFLAACPQIFLPRMTTVVLETVEASVRLGPPRTPEAEMVRPAPKRPPLRALLRRAVEPEVPLLVRAIRDALEIPGVATQLTLEPPVPIAARPRRPDRMPRRPEAVSGVVYPDLPAIETCGSHERRHRTSRFILCSPPGENQSLRGRRTQCSYRSPLIDRRDYHDGRSADHHLEGRDGAREGERRGVQQHRSSSRRGRRGQVDARSERHG